MPYKDPEKRRAYRRQYREANGNGSRKPKGTPQETRNSVLPLPVRVETAKDVLSMVAEQMAAVKAADDAGTCERARTLGYLAGVALRAIEAADMTARLEELEATIESMGGKRYG